MVDAFEIRLVPATATLVEQGCKPDQNDTFYIIQEGTLIVQWDGDEFHRICAKNSWGEQAFIYQAASTVTLVAASNPDAGPTLLLTMDQKTYLAIAFTNLSIKPLIWCAGKVQQMIAVRGTNKPVRTAAQGQYQL